MPLASTFYLDRARGPSALADPRCYYSGCVSGKYRLTSLPEPYRGLLNRASAYCSRPLFRSVCSAQNTSAGREELEVWLESQVQQHGVCLSSIRIVAMNNARAHQRAADFPAEVLGHLGFGHGDFGKQMGDGFISAGVTLAAMH